MNLNETSNSTAEEIQRTRNRIRRSWSPEERSQRRQFAEVKQQRLFQVLFSDHQLARLALQDASSNRSTPFDDRSNQRLHPETIRLEVNASHAVRRIQGLVDAWCAQVLALRLERSKR